MTRAETIDLGLKVATPLVTFALGVAATLLIKRSDKKTTLLAMYAKDISDSAAEWHAQLCELKAVAGNKKKFNEQLATYKRDRKVMPKFKRAMAVLAPYKEAAEVAGEANRIFNLLTEPITEDTNACVVVLLGSENMMPDNSKCPVSLKTLDEVLEELDGRVQKINKLAAKLL